MADSTPTLPQSINGSMTALETALKTKGSAGTAATVAVLSSDLDNLKSNAVTSSTLSTTLQGYATTASLSNYAKQSDLTVYAKTSDVQGFAKSIDLDVYAKAADVNTQLNNYNTQWSQDNAAFKQDVQNSIKDMASVSDVNKNTDDIKNLPASLEASFKDKFLSTEGNAAFGDKVCTFQTTSNITHINGQGKLNGGITSSNFQQWQPVGFTLGNNTPLDIRNLTNVNTSNGGTDYSLIYGNEGGGGCSAFLNNTPGFAGVTPTADFYIAATDGTVQNPFFRFNVYTSGNNTENLAISANRYGFWYGTSPCPSYASTTTVNEAPTFFEEKDVAIADGQKVTFPNAFASGSTLSAYTQLLNKGTPVPVFVSVTEIDNTSVTFSVIGVDGKAYSGQVHISLMVVVTQ